MQEQGKRLLLAVGLALGLMLLWQVIFPGEKAKPKPPVDDSGSAAALIMPTRSIVGQPLAPGSAPALPAPAVSPVGPAPVGSNAAAGSDVAPVAAGSDVAPVAAGSDVAPVAAGSDAVPVAAPVPEPVAVETPAFIPLTAQPEAVVELAFPNVAVAFTNQGGSLKSWHLLDEKYKRADSKGEFLPPQPGRGALQVNFAQSTYYIPENAPWIGEQLSPAEVRYTYTGPELKVVKTFLVDPVAYLVRLQVDVSLVAGGNATQQLAVSSFAFQDPAIKPQKNSGRGSLEWRAACDVSGKPWTAISKVVHDPSISAERRTKHGITWGGFAQGFLMMSTAPKRNPGESITCIATPGYDGEQPLPGLMRVDLVFPPAVLKSGDAPLSREMWTFIGPTSYHKLKESSDVAGYSTGFHNVIDFGWFGFIGKPLLWLLSFFHGLVGNWGLAIIMLTLVVKGATLYWTTKSMRSMKAMAALAPKMKELQARYKDDKQRIQVETMALYKQHGVNPLAGCLPVLLQMPIWIALYRMLSSAGELYLEPFVPGWINDLTQPDPFHILPILLIITMFAQAKLQPQTQTGFQQKLLMYGLPLGFGVAAFFFPSGLSLYIFTNTLISAAHSIYMNKFDKKSIELTAMMVASMAEAEAKKAGAGKTTSKAKPVVDAVAVEKRDDDDSDDADDDDDGLSKARTSGPARRPKKKGTRKTRGRN